jgi:hypothetical protein
LEAQSPADIPLSNGCPEYMALHELPLRNCEADFVEGGIVDLIPCGETIDTFQRQPGAEEP